jgi:hypothetical protein
LPLNRISKPSTYIKSTPDGYYYIGGFAVMKGMADGFVPHFLSPIQQLRITITADSDRWVIINEVLINSFTLFCIQLSLICCKVVDLNVSTLYFSSNSMYFCLFQIYIKTFKEENEEINNNLLALR